MSGVVGRVESAAPRGGRHKGARWERAAVAGALMMCSHCARPAGRLPGGADRTQRTPKVTKGGVRDPSQLVPVRQWTGPTLRLQSGR